MTRQVHRKLLLIQAVLAAGAVLFGVAVAGGGRWPPAGLATIAAFAIASELATRPFGGDDVLISGSFLAIVLAAIVYGGAPGAVIGLLAIAAGWVRSREAGWKLRNNLINFAWFPLLAGSAFRGLVSLLGVSGPDPGFYLCAFLACGVALAANLVGVAICVHWRAGAAAVLRGVGAMLAPVVAAELFSAVLTVAAVWVTVRLHVVGLIMFGCVLAIFQHLVGELLTSRRRATELQRIATTDALTGLPNRVSFRRVVDARAADGDRFAVLLMDLDRFKEVNDTLGHAYGDRLLRELGPRLRDAAGPDSTVARLGGDEFAIMVVQVDDDPLAVELVVTRLLAAVAEPYAIEELSLEVGASVGVARCPQDGGDAESLLRCADVAMYAAKDAQTDYKLYAADQNHHSKRRLSVLSDIRRALTGDEIVVHYQPIVDVARGEVTGAEGLVRWEHPEHGLIPPAGFVAVVEQSGLIGPLTRRVLEQSIAQCADWRREGRDMSVAVNLSVRNLLDRDLPREIERLLDGHRLPADALQLEITESMIMSDPERALATVSRLSDLGVRLSVDDFGTGYSSLANLRRLPIDELKIDRSFVSPMLQDESDLIIVRSTINLGHDLGLRIIAEGVEDGPTLTRLGELGCDLAQGYHLSRPLAAPAFLRWLSEAAPAPGPLGV